MYSPPRSAVLPCSEIFLAVLDMRITITDEKCRFWTHTRSFAQTQRHTNTQTHVFGINNIDAHHIRRKDIFFPSNRNAPPILTTNTNRRRNRRDVDANKRSAFVYIVVSLDSCWVFHTFIHIYWPIDSSISGRWEKENGDHVNFSSDS